MKQYKAKYIIRESDGTSKTHEDDLQGLNEGDVQTQIAREHCSKSTSLEHQRIIKIVSINELTSGGKEIIRTGPSVGGV